MRHSHGIGIVIVSGGFLLLLSTPGWSQDPGPPGKAPEARPSSPGIAPVLPPPLPEVQDIHTIKGEIVRVERGAYLVRDSNGKQIRLPIGKQTKVDTPAYLVGDEIEAAMTSAGEVVSMTLKKSVSKRFTNP